MLYKAIKLIGVVILSLVLVTGCSDLDDDPASPGGGENQAPAEPSNPSPSDDAEDISIEVELSWSCTDPDGDPLTYDVHYGTDKNEPTIVENLSTANYSLNGELVIDENYYWKIIAHDDQGNSTEGDWWEFTTSEDGGGGSGVPWAEEIQPIFSNSCIVCHGGLGGLTLSSYISALSGGQSGDIIIPGDSENSILYKRISGNTAGERMPQGGTPLAQDKIDLIKDWIDEGALDN